MTVPVPLARLAEGWCPHPNHGRLQPAAGGGRCSACDGTWRLWPKWQGADDALVFQVDLPDSQVTCRGALASDLARSQETPAALIGWQVAHTHEDAAKQLAREPKP